MFTSGIRNESTIGGGLLYERTASDALFQCLDKEAAERELTAWIEQAQSSGMKILKDTAKKLLQ